jgi:hypothetical protein
MLEGVTPFEGSTRMKISLFQSDTDPEVFGFTADFTGQNLPNDFGPWRRADESAAMQVTLRENLNGMRASTPLTRAVKRDGFYLATTVGRSGVATNRG